MANLDRMLPVDATRFEGLDIIFFERPMDGPVPHLVRMDAVGTGAALLMRGEHLSNVYSHFYQGAGTLNSEPGEWRPQRCSMRLLVNLEPFRMAMLWAPDDAWAERGFCTAFVLHEGPFAPDRDEDEDDSGDDEEEEDD